MRWIYLKLFKNKLEFYKNSFKMRFCQFAYFVRKLDLGQTIIFGHIFGDIRIALGF